VWETAIKLALNKLKPVVELSIITNDPTITFIAFEIAEAMRVQHLPLYHQDPFDRAIIAHASQKGLVLITADKTLRLYENEVRMIFV
jgi:PIN domain nuclease of toxin-antitoxin system